MALVTLPVGLVFAIAEAGPRGATWGKRRLGLRVIGPDGRSPSLPRSLVRTACKLLPWELAHTAVHRLPQAAAPRWVSAVLAAAWILGFAYALPTVFDAGRRTLYDRLSRTRVVR